MEKTGMWTSNSIHQGWKDFTIAMVFLATNKSPLASLHWQEHCSCFAPQTIICHLSGDTLFHLHLTLSTPLTSALILPSTLFPTSLCITDSFNNSNASTCPPLTLILWFYDFMTYPLFFHLSLTDSFIDTSPLWLCCLCCYSDFHLFSLVIWIYLSYSHFSHIMPFHVPLSFYSFIISVNSIFST